LHDRFSFGLSTKDRWLGAWNRTQPGDSRSRRRAIVDYDQSALGCLRFRFQPARSDGWHGHRGIQDHQSQFGPVGFFSASGQLMTRCRLTALFALLLAICIRPAVAAFASQQTGSASSEPAEEKLEQDFTDPLTTLPQVIVRDSYTPANYGTK